MSVYVRSLGVLPPRVTLEDHVIIRVTCINKSVRLAHCLINVKVVDPLGRVYPVVRRKEVVILPRELGGTFRDVYSYFISRDSTPGKWRVELELIVQDDGEVKVAETVFFVDHVSVVKETETKLIVKNLAGEPTPIYVVYDTELLYKLLHPYEEIDVVELLGKKPVALMYSNFRPIYLSKHPNKC